MMSDLPSYEMEKEGKDDEMKVNKENAGAIASYINNLT